MKLSRRQRIALELLGPPVLGAVMAMLWAMRSLVRHSFARNEPGWSLLNTLAAAPIMLALYLVFALPMVGIQTGAYALIMEWRFARGLDPRSWRMVALSTGLGFASGAVIAIGYGLDRTDTWYFFNGLGLAVGFTLGWLIKVGSAENQTRV